MFENSVYFNHYGEFPAIEKSVEHFDSLILPSHFVLAHAKDLGGFLNRVKNTHGVEYYIDPALIRFRVGANFRDEQGNLSDWNHDLVQYYGSPIMDHLDNNRNLTYYDLTQEEREEAVKRGCDLQLQAIDNANENASLGEYMDVVELKPRALIPWYVKIRRANHLRTNEEFVQIAREYTGYPIKPCYFLEQSFIREEENRQRVADSLSSLGIREAFIWVEGFDNTLGISEYYHMIDLVDKISNEGVAPQFMYGDYFANLLSFFGLSGTGYGMFYMESREEKTDDGEGGGGDGLKRYYVDEINEFLGITDAIDFGESFDIPICDCAVCDYNLNSWDDILKIGNDYEPLARHYLETRDNHKEKVQQSTLSELLDELEEAEEDHVEWVENIESTVDAYHLRKWRKAVVEYVNRETPHEVGDIGELN